MSKFLIITSKRSKFNRKSMASSLTQLGIINFGIIFEENGKSFAEVSNNFMKTSRVISSTNAITNHLFPDKLKDLNGYEYKVIFQVLRIYQKLNIDIPMKYFYFVDSVAKVQNANVKLQKLNASAENELKLIEMFDNRLIDLLLNERSKRLVKILQLQIYEENDFCAVIPMNSKFLKLRKYQAKFFKAHFMFILIVLIFGAAVWRLFKNYGSKHSHWKFICAVLASCLGQNVSIRKEKWILKLLLQLFIFSNVFGAILYNSVINSIYISPLYLNYYKSFNDLMESGEPLTVDDYFDEVMTGNFNYEILKLEDKISIFKYVNVFPNRIVTNITILRCNFMKHVLKFQNVDPDSFYHLPGSIMPYYNQLATGSHNPFLDRLQAFMDWSFEAGLPMKWEKMSEIKQENKGYDVMKVISDEYLKLKHLKSILYIFVAGISLAMIVFLMEIFYHDFMEKLSKSLMGKIASKISRKSSYSTKISQWTKFKDNFSTKSRSKLNIRFIEVKPINV